MIEEQTAISTLLIDPLKYKQARMNKANRTENIAR